MKSRLINLEPDWWQQLEMLAIYKNTTVTELVREAVRQQYKLDTTKYKVVLDMCHKGHNPHKTF